MPRAAIPLRHAYRLLNHGPTVLVSSAHAGQRNVMAAAWNMPLDFDPPKVAVVIDKSTLTRELVEASGEFVLAVPTRAIADKALTRMGVDNLGLDGADRRYMLLLAENYGGGPVGVETIAAALSEARDAIEEVIEPYLLQQGLIQRTPRGRMLAMKAWRHIGLEPPNAPAQSGLFD